MEKHVSNGEHLSGLKALYEEPAARALLRAASPSLPDPIAQWLARLCLLYGVPFNHLVADERMLPMESIRFFFLNQNWLDSMVDGALSVAAYSTRDRAYRQAMRPVIRQSTARKIQQERGRLRKKPGTPETEPELVMTGLLLRSALVSGWPGLEIAAAGISGSPPAGPVPLQLLRMDLLSSSVLLCIFSGFVQEVQINQPSEGLHFGVEEIGSPPRLVISPRWVSGASAGQEITPDESQWVNAVWRQQDGVNTRVLDIGGLRSQLIDSLVNLKAIPPGAGIGPSEFAIQMVKAPFQQIFQNEASPPDIASAAGHEPEHDESAIMEELFRKI